MSRVARARRRAAHLLGRFVGSVRPRRLTGADLAFVRAALEPGELECWQRLGRADRAESVVTGRAAVEALGANADPRWVAAALLHDVGKVDTTYGVVRRSLATMMATVVGRRRARSLPGGIGRYVRHDEVGATLLGKAGARPEAVAWTAVHHRPELWAGSGIPPETCEILAAADGEPTPG